MSDKRNVTCWTIAEKQRFLNEVKRSNAPTTVIADLHGIPEPTGLRWALEAGMGNRQQVNRRKENGGKAKRPVLQIEHHKRRDLLTAWKTP